MGDSDLEGRFKKAAEESKQLSSRPDNETLLDLYALYKQGSMGDITGVRPGITDPVGRAKYDAWSKLKGTSQPDAMRQYVDLVERLKG